MRRRVKYQFSKGRGNKVSFLLWLTALAMLAAGGGFWIWHEHGKKPPAKVPARIAEAPRPVTPPPIAPTPVAATVERQETPSTQARSTRNPLEAQIALVQRGISPGSLDGVVGSQTRAALTTFQTAEHLPVSGILDEPTKVRLLISEPVLTNYCVTTNDLARLQPLSSTWLGKSQQTALDFETVLELVAEKFQSNPDLIRRLNPVVNWTNLSAGAVLQVPNAVFPEPKSKAAFIEIHLSGKILEAFDASTNLLVHFPCSIAKLAEKRPVGELHIKVIAPRPNYTFDPEVFPESPEARELGRKLVLPAGPNNPVGVAWIGLDLPGYGIHGTPRPEDVGRTESHGCFRLANWNAEYLLRLVTVGTTVYVLE